MFCYFIEKRLLSCEIGKIFRNIYFYRIPSVATSEIKKVFNFQHFLNFQSHFAEAVFFLPLSSQKFLVVILSASEGLKVKLTLEPPGDFEHGAPGFGIQCLNHQAIFKLIETTSYFSKMSILTNEAPLALVFFQGLHITCKTYCNLSIKGENYQ